MPTLSCPNWIDYLQAFSAPAAVAVASIAIWSTFKIARDNQKATKEERDLRARAIALAIFPEILELKAKVIGARSILKLSAKESLDAHRFNELSRLKLVVPPTLKAATEQMWLLGEKTAAPILQAVSVSDQFDRMVEKWVEDLNSHRKFEPGSEELLEIFEKHLDVAGKLIEEAESVIGPIHDGPVSSE